MHRQRKKDMNLKPNRVLDKRSSRGMIYENEELRLRTLSINDEVDRSHSDVKKLKKENENLKREIWYLRNEYDILEDKLKHVCTMTSFNQDDIPDAPEERFLLRRKSTGGQSIITSTFDSDDDQSHLLLMMDDDNLDANSVLGMNFGDSEIPGTSYNVSQQAQLAVQESGEISPVPETSKHHHHLYRAGIPPDLEVICEQSEHTNSNSMQTLANSTTSTSPIPIDATVTTMIEQHPTPSSPISGSPSPLPNPIIEITPASSPIPGSIIVSKEEENNFEHEGEESLPNTEQENREQVTDFGCVAVIPAKFQVTSEIKVSSDDSGYIQDGITNGVSPTPSDLNKMRPKSLNATNSKCHRHSSLLQRSNNSKTTPACCIHSSFQSEPSLTSIIEGRNSALDFSNNFLHQSQRGNILKPITIEMICSHQSNSDASWNSIDRNVVIGYFDENIELRPQDIIDALESRFDSSLELILGVRVLQPGRVFISLKTFAGVCSLLKENKLLIRDIQVQLIDASRKYSRVILAGLPVDMADLTIISVLNQFGQVTAPLQRRTYKGVDTAERFCSMHLVRPLPNVISIAGIETKVSVSIEEEIVATTSVPTAPLVQNETIVMSPYRNSFPNEMPTTSSPIQKNVLNQSQSAPHNLQQHLNPNAHKQVGRSCSSAPRLEGVNNSTSSLSAAILAKRQMSVCGGNVPSSHMQSQQLQQSASSSNHSILTPQSSNNSNAPPPSPNIKKPLARLMKSSPGNLTSENETHQPTGLKAAFYSSFSLDPRRSSNASSQGGDHHQQLSHNNNYMVGKDRKCNMGKREKLPWCGCI